MMPGTIKLADEFVGTTRKTSIVVLLNGHIVKQPSKYVHTQKSLLFLTFVGENLFLQGVTANVETHKFKKVK